MLAMSDNPDFKIAAASLIDDLNNFNEGQQRWQDVKRSIRFNVEQMVSAHDSLASRLHDATEALSKIANYPTLGQDHPIDLYVNVKTIAAKTLREQT
jgi:hypothetical protein